MCKMVKLKQEVDLINNLLKAQNNKTSLAVRIGLKNIVLNIGKTKELKETIFK